MPVHRVGVGGVEEKMKPVRNSKHSDHVLGKNVGTDVERCVLEKRAK